MHLKKLNLNSPLGWVLTNDTKNKTNKNKADTKKKTKKNSDKYLLYNSQHSFSKFKTIDEFKELSIDSMSRLFGTRE